MKKLVAAAMASVLLASTAVFTAATPNTSDAAELEITANGGVPAPVIYDSEGNVFESASPDIVDLYSDEIPSEYDMRTDDPNMFTLTANQGNHGTCWAFAASSSLESNMMKQEMINQGEDVYLSPAKLAWYALAKEARNAEGRLSDKPFDAGGNSIVASITLANGISDTEENVPYSQTDRSKMAYVGCGGEDTKVVTLKDTYEYNSKDRDAIKRAIMTNGAMNVGFYSNSDDYSEKYAYYQNKVDNLNHLVLIVGWDDDYAVENFNEDCHPENPGAWLVRNSWGDSWGNDGYFYISYEEPSLDDFASLVADEDSFDNVYSYTHSVYDDSIDYSYDETLKKSAGSVANVFTAKGNESLKKVGIYTLNNNLTGNVKIYKGVTSSPENEEPVQTTEFNQPIKGFHTIELSEPVALSKGEVFSVVFELEVSTENEQLCIAIENDSEDDEYIYSSNAGESYYFNENTWKEVSSFGEGCHNAYVFAYTDNDDDTEQLSSFKTKLEEVINTSESLDSSKYSQYLYERLNKAVEANKAAVDSTDLQTVKNAYARINEAYQSLLSPAEIASESDMASVTNQMKDKTFYNTEVAFTDDITVTDESNLFSNYNTGYYCTDTNGNGHTVTIQDGSNIYGLMFAISDAAIKNLNVNGDITNTNQTFGGIAALLGEGASIENCSFDGSFTETVGDDYSQPVYVGGIVARAVDSSIKDCSAGGNITVNGSGLENVRVGGIAGTFTNADVSGCINNADIVASAQEDGMIYSGGIVGLASSGVSKCLNFGDISGTNASGIANVNASSPRFESCGNNGEIEGSKKSDAIGISIYENSSDSQGGSTEKILDGCYNNSSSDISDSSMTNCYDLNTNASAESFKNGEIAYRLNTVDKTADNSGLWTVKDGKTVFADDETGAVSAINVSVVKMSYSIYAPYNQEVSLSQKLLWKAKNGNYITSVAARENLNDVDIFSTEQNEDYEYSAVDFNLDKKVDEKDYALALREIAGIGELDELDHAICDVNGDGVLDLRDAILFIIAE